MHIIAMQTMDGPGFPYLQLQHSIYFPTATILISWLLIRWKRWLVIPAVMIAVILGDNVLSGVTHPITRGAMVEEFGWSYVFAIIISAAVPFFVIALLFLNEKRRSNRGAEPVPVNSPPAARPPGDVG